MAAEDIAEFQAAIDKTQMMWPTVMNWEQREAPATPKYHNGHPFL